ncbi:MAG: hypothetical protein FDZ70_05560 [Actinobacteria bacterium]|nr:MAG: hypothetical protein FDZ70_05560 [Actinomycetota bacterium]
MLVPMAKVEIIGPKNLFFDVLSMLHEGGRLHIEDLSRKIQTGELPLDQMEVYARQEKDRERMEEMLIRVRAILKALNAPTGGLDSAARKREYDRMWHLDGAQMEEEVALVIEEVEERTSGLATAHTSIESELALLARYEPILQKIQPLAKQIVSTGAFDSVALLVERRYKGALESLKEELGKLTKNQCEIVSTDVDEDTTAAIVVFPKAHGEAVHKFLAMENVNQIRLPSEFEDMPFDAAYDAIRERRKNLPTELSGITKDLDEMSGKWYLRLSVIRDVLIDKTDEIAAIPQFGRTEYAFVINGWVPAGDVAQLRKDLASRWGGEIIIEQQEIDEHEYSDTPVALKNPEVVKPFEFLLAQYGMPKYGTVDPTWFLFLFYPLFFGMIVGDVGYGLVMLGIIIWLRIKYHEKPAMQLATAILGPAATAVVAFGIIYGELFGNVPAKMGWIAGEPTKWFGLIPTFHRVALVTNFMYIAIAVGFVQVMFGLILGIVNGIRTKHMSHVYEKGGMLGVLLGLPLIIFASLPMAGEVLGETLGFAVQGVAALLMLAGFFFAIKGGKILGGVESILQFSNVASYIRIMAVGLAGAIFADAVNGIIEKTGNFFLGAIIALFLHGLNFIIAAFSPSIHAVRLNFLEFFGKFYETGKQKYSPFQKTGGEGSA